MNRVLVTGVAVARHRRELAEAFGTERGAGAERRHRHRALHEDADGRAAVNPTGNPGMATGGTGDVLSGIVGALLARRLDPWVAATVAVYVHGLAGDVAAGRLGQESLLAGDLVDALPEAIRSLGHGHS